MIKYKDVLFRSHSSINKKNCLSRFKKMFVVRYLYCQICQCILTFADIIVFTSFGREHTVFDFRSKRDEKSKRKTQTPSEQNLVLSLTLPISIKNTENHFFKKNRKTFLTKPYIFFWKSPKMLCQFDLNKFWNERVGPRKQAASAKLRDTMAILTELLRVCTESNGHPCS